MPDGFRMTIGAEQGGVARATAAFTAFAVAQAVPAGVRRSMSVVLDELLANAVSHGLTGRAEGAVTLDVTLTADRMVVTVADDGAPFDPFGRAAPDTTLPVAERPIGGLGIHLVRQLVDEARYERRGDHNVVMLTARLDGGASELPEDG